MYKIRRKYKMCIHKDFLYDLYINKKYTSGDIAKYFNISKTTVGNLIKKYNIKSNKCG